VDEISICGFVLTSGFLLKNIPPNTHTIQTVDRKKFLENTEIEKCHITKYKFSTEFENWFQPQTVKQTLLSCQQKIKYSKQVDYHMLNTLERVFQVFA